MLSSLLIALAAAAPAPPLDALPQTTLAPELRCLLGAYALPGGSVVTITGRDGQPRGLQVTRSDGRFGALQEQADGGFAGEGLDLRFAPCAEGRLTLTEGPSTAIGTRLGLAERATEFASGSVRLHGKLVLPPGAPPRALAVWIDGSNNNPSTDDTVWAYELARRGVAVFTYDKRGTGRSAGAPSSDFHVRAQDTVAAVQAARQLAPAATRVGVIGASQGGWVAPLVARQEPLDFVVAAFAMAEGPIAQDRLLVEQQLSDAGFGDEARTQSRTLTALTERIVRSGLREGYDELDAFKAAHASAPWMAAIQPRSYTGIFLKFDSDALRAHGPAMAQGLSFDHEPRPVLEQLRSRQLWLLGGSDRQAPSEGTQAILRDLQRQGRDVSVIVFPRADHGLIETRTPTDGRRLPVYSAGLFDATADWVLRGTLPGAGRFVVMP